MKTSLLDPEQEEFRRQQRLLSEVPLRMNPEVAVGHPYEDRYVIKNVPECTYLVVTREQHRILEYFATAKPVREVLPELIRERMCPPLREFYELVLKAIQARILLTPEIPAREVRAVDWKPALPSPAIHLFALVSIGAAMSLLLTREIALPRDGQTVLLGVLPLIAAYSLGHVLAACVLRGRELEVYHPRWKWNTLLPHFTIDLREAAMGGRSCAITVALARLAPAFLYAAINLYWAPQYGYLALLGILHVTDPLLHSPMVDLLRGLYRRLTPATSQDFQFVRNRFLWFVVKTRIRHADFKYLAILTGYTLLWLGVVMYVHLRLFDLNAERLLQEIWTTPAPPWLNIGLLTALAAAILVSGGLILWILLRNLQQLLHWKWPAWPVQKTASARQLTRDDVLVLLSKSLLFQECPPDIREEIADLLIALDVRGGRFIIREGEEGDCLYLIACGKAEVLGQTLSGRMERLAVLGPGEVFGEISLLQPEKRTRSVRSLHGCTLLALRRSDFQRLVVARLGAQKIQEILQKRAFLHRLPLCASWTQKSIALLASQASLITIQAGRLLIRQGNDNHFFYIVYEGRFEVSSDGKTMAILEAGDFFGEISLLQNCVSMADVRALQESRVLSVHASDFLRFISSDFALGLQFEELSSQRLRRPVFPLDWRTGDHPLGV